MRKPRGPINSPDIKCEMVGEVSRPGRTGGDRTQRIRGKVAQERCIRICVWSNAGTKAVASWWNEVEKIVPRACFASIVKICRVTQKADGQKRLDVYMDNVDEALVERAISALSKHYRARRHQSYKVRKHADASDDIRRVEMRKARPHLYEQEQPVRILSWNICGLTSKWIELEQELVRVPTLCVFLQETLIREGHWPIGRQKFQVFESPACVGKSRGLAILMSKQTPAVLEYQSPHMMCVKAREVLGDRPLFFVNVHIPSSDKLRRNGAIVNLIEHVAKWIMAGEVIVGGDWNGPVNTVLSTIHTHGCDLVKIPTAGPGYTFHRIGRSISKIDYFIASGAVSHLLSSSRVNRFLELSDHYPISTGLKSRKMILTADKVGSGTTSARKVQLKKMGAGIDLNSIVNHNLWEVLADIENPEPSKWPEVTERVISDLKLWSEPRKGGIRQCKRTFKLSKQAITLLQRKQQTWEQVLKARDSQSVDTDNIVEEYRVVREESRNLVRRESHEAFIKHINEGLKYFRGGPEEEKTTRPFWKFIKNLCGKERDVGNNGLLIQDPSGVLAPDWQTAVDTWRNYYAKLFSDITGHSLESSWWKKYPVSRKTRLHGLNRPIGWGELAVAANSMKKGKATSVSDQVPAEFLQLCTHKQKGVPVSKEPTSVMGEALLNTVNSIFANGALPAGEVWSLACIVPILKKGDETETDNYRGIALISTIVKLITKVIAERCRRAIEAQGRIHMSQGGFRRREECMGQVITLYEMCLRRRIAGKKTYLLFIDFQKAFDSVPREALLYKIEQMGVRGKSLQFFRTLYEASQGSVRVGGHVSQPFSWERGVRQGCPASPLLFNIFINDLAVALADAHLGARVPGLPNGTSRCPALLWADDVVCLAESRAGLRRCLKIVCEWADKWEMSLGVKKCAVMAIGAKGESSEVAKQRLEEGDAWEIKGELVPVVVEYKYLGINFNSELDLDQIEAQRANATRKAWFAVERVCNLSYLPPHVKLTLVKSLVLPVALFGGELLGMCKEHCQKTQKWIHKAMRAAFGTRQNASSVAMGNESRIPSIAVLRSAQRARAFGKWGKHSRTWLPLLIKHPMSSREWTWVTGTTRWMNRWAPNLSLVKGTLAAKTLFSQMKKLGSEQVACKDKTISGAAYVKFNLKRSNKDIARLDMVPCAMAKVYHQMRIGAFWTAKRSADAGIIDKAYRKVCPCCLAEKPETIRHILLECPCWAGSRSAHLLPLLHSVQVGHGENNAEYLLLGGSVNEVSLPTERTLRKRRGAKKVRGSEETVQNGQLRNILKFLGDIWEKREAILVPLRQSSERSRPGLGGAKHCLPKGGSHRVF